jgi:hypothetical protein
MTVKKSFSFNYHRIFHSFSLGQFLKDNKRKIIRNLKNTSLFLHDVYH